MITETTEEEEQWLYRINEQIFGPVSRHILSERLVSGKVSPEIQVARNQGEFHHVSRVSIFRTVLETRNQNLEDQRKRSRRIRLTTAFIILAGGCAVAFHLVNEQVAALQNKEQSQYESVLQERKAAFVLHQAVPLPEVEPLVTQEMLDAAQVEYDERMAAAEAKSKRSRSARKPRVRKNNVPSVTDSCQLKPRDVFQVMSRYKGKIGACVEQEKKRAAATGSTLPDTITLGFTVRPSGQVIQFDLGNPAYRKGLLFKCLKKTMKKVVFPKRGGSDCSTNLPVKIAQ